MFSFLQFRLNRNAKASTPQLFYHQIFSLRCLSTTASNATNSTQRTIDYLINSVGFSRESALTIANRIALKTLKKPKSVVTLLKSYGFTQAHITSVIIKSPSLLVTNPDKILKPKLDFLTHNGFSGHNLADIVSNDPNFLKRSLGKLIIPCFGFLKSFFHTNDEIVSLFLVKRGTQVLHNFSETMEPNINTLRHHSVPDSSISKMIMIRPRSLARNTAEFCETVRGVKEMGFDPKSMRFIHALCTVLRMRKDKFLSKVEVVKSFGWSESQVQSLFLKQPMFMNYSEEHIKKSLDFFMNKLEWTIDDIVRDPFVLICSVEKRIMPRYCVIQLLISKGLLKKNRVARAFMVSEHKFLEMFLVKYDKKFPQLLQMYQNNKGFL